MKTPLGLITLAGSGWMGYNTFVKRYTSITIAAWGTTINFDPPGITLMELINYAKTQGKSIPLSKILEIAVTGRISG